MLIFPQLAEKYEYIAFYGKKGSFITMSTKARHLSPSRPNPFIQDTF